MLENYLPIAVFIIIAGVLGLLMLGLGFLFGKGAKTKAKLSPLNVVLKNLKTHEYHLMSDIT